MKSEAILRAEAAIAAFKNGEILIVMDDEDRENEGDLVLAGIFSTPEKINFLAKEARGLICVSITRELAHTLDLPPMVAQNSSNHETAFTVSIDARDAKTGISAFERDLTIQLMCAPNAAPSDFVRPGHIFPLIAKDGGVLERVGHTEASVDLCRLSGLKPISVICEIMKDDGQMACRGDKFIAEFAAKHALKTLFVSDLIEYRLQFENLVREVGASPCSIAGVSALRRDFSDHLGRIHSVFCFGTAQGEPLVKFHSISSDLALLTSQSAYNALFGALERLRLGGGFLVFLACENGGDVKSLGIGAQILKALGVSEFALLSHSQNAELSALSGFNLRITRCIEV